MVPIDLGHYCSSTLQTALWQLYQSGKHTDLTVTCGVRKFHVHKAVVCAQSSFFNAACGGGFKESLEGCIDLPDDDPDMVERLFQFLYLGNYSDGEYFDEMPSIPAMMEAKEVETLVKTKSDAFLTTKMEDPANDVDYVPEEPDPEPLEYESGSDDADDTDDADDADDAEDADEADNTDETDDADDADDAKPDAMAAKTEITSVPPISIFTSLRMYVMGDKYDVPALQLLAKQRFMRTAENNWQVYNKFPDVLDELFMTTASDDPLRWWICSLIEYPYMHEQGIREWILPVVAKHGDLSLKILETITDRVQTNKDILLVAQLKSDK